MGPPSFLRVAAADVALAMDLDLTRRASVWVKRTRTTRRQKRIVFMSEAMGGSFG